LLLVAVEVAVLNFQHITQVAVAQVAVSVLELSLWRKLPTQSRSDLDKLLAVQVDVVVIHLLQEVISQQSAQLEVVLVPVTQVVQTALAESMETVVVQVAAAVHRFTRKHLGQETLAATHLLKVLLVGLQYLARLMQVFRLAAAVAAHLKQVPMQLPGAQVKEGMVLHHQ
jgi:hypothetical protein